MPLPKGNEDLQASLDTSLQDVFNQIAPKMEAFVAGKGEYFQGIDTAVALPEDGAFVDQDLTKTPVYQTESWVDFGITIPSKLPMSVAVDNYHGPKGSLVVTDEAVERPYITEDFAVVNRFLADQKAGKFPATDLI